MPFLPPTAAALLRPLTLAAALMAASIASKAAPQDVDMPAQRLADAVKTLARQAGLTIAADDALLAGRMAPAVRGRLEPRDALWQLLAGSGLAAVEDGATLVIRPAASSAEPALPEVRVRASAEALPGDVPKPYAGGQVARGSRLGMLGNVDLFDTPFSTRAYTTQTVQDQVALRADEVFQSDPSIRSSVSQGQPLDQSSIRGFLVFGGDFRFDGVAGLFDYGVIPVQNYERVEVTKGPNAMLSGMSPGGSVGGVVNFVPKRALDRPSRQLSAFVTDDGLLGTQFDLGQRFGVDNAFGARLNVYAADGDGYADNTSSRTVAPLLALDYRGERFRAVLDLGITDGDYAGGTPNLRFSGTALPEPPDAELGLRRGWESTDRRSTFGLLMLEGDLSPTWTATLRLGRQRTTSDDLGSVGLIVFDEAGDFEGGPYSYGFYNERKVIDAGLTGTFSTLGVKHRLAVNATRFDEEYGEFYVEGSAFDSNIYAPADLPEPALATAPYALGSKLRLTGVGVADTLSSQDGRISLIVGLRHQQVEASDVYGSPPYDESKVTPAVAVLFKPQAGVSLYANYIEALSRGDTAPLGTENANENLAPIQTKQAEVGAKWNFGTWALTTALFDIRRPSALIDTDNVYRYVGEQRNRGLEIETFGEQWPGVRLLGGVTLLRGKLTKTGDDDTEGKQAVGVPKVQLNLRLEWDVAALRGLTLTGRVVHTGSAYYDVANTVEVPSWCRVDLGVRYRTALQGRPLTLRANLGNATNDGHWEIAGRNILTIAPPRTLRLSATVDF